MPYILFMSYGIVWTLISLPLQMVERLLRTQLDSVANHVKARQSLIQRSVTWLATESGWARRKRHAICSGKLCGGFIIFEQCSPCDRYPPWPHRVTSTTHLDGGWNSDEHSPAPLWRLCDSGDVYCVSRLTCFGRPSLSLLIYII